MAEPARRLDDDQDSPVYDKKGIEPSDPRPDLKSLEGGGETTPPKSGHLREAGSENKPGQEELASAEESAGGSDPAPQHENQVGRGYHPGVVSSKKAIRSKLLGSRRRKLVFGGSVAAAAIAAAIAIFLFLLPLKILHIVNNLQDRFYATSQNAVQNETDNLLKQYVKNHVLPSYKSCGSTINRNCSVKVVGSNPVSNLYKAWANDRLENKLATKYGIEFQKRADGWYLKTPSTSGNGINIGKDGEKIDGAFQKANISEIRQAVQDETRWYQVYFRFKVGRLLEEKYGIRRCLIFCGITDPLAQNVADQKIAAKLFLTQRVLVPRTNTLGIALECLLSGCTGTDYQPTDASTGVNAAEGGQPEDKATDTAIRESLVSLAGKYDVILDSAALEELVQTYTKMSEQGFQNYIISEGLSKLPFVSEDAAKGASDKIPFIGWIDLLSRMILAGNNAGPNIKKLSYVTNASAAVALFSMYRTYADEIKTGHVNATEVGSLTDSLGPGGTNSPYDPEIGGNVGAEGAPLYQSLINGQKSVSSSTAVSLGGLFTTKVLAASSSTTTQNPDSYKCNNGDAVPTGQLVCNEEILGQGNHYANSLHDFLNLPFINIFTKIAGLWHSTIGQLFNWVNDIFGPVIQGIVSVANATCHVPGASFVSPYCQAKDLADKYLPQIEQAVVQFLIPDPFSSNMSGGRTFDMMAAGADVAGNDSAHTTLGGKQLTNQQAAAIVNQQNNEALQNYQNESFFARLTDKNSDYSPISRLAMALPMNWSSGLQSIGSFFGNPFSSLGHAFSSIFSPNLALAATAQADPFGVVQYGYPSGSIPSDPEGYWDKNCSDNAAYAYRKTNDWNVAASKTLDQNQMPLNTSVNPCLLIMATTGSDGGLFDSSVLTQDDLADGSTPTSGGGSSTDGLTNPFPGGWIPNRLDMGFDGTFKDKVVAPFSGTITYASGSFSNWGGYVELKADQRPSGLPTSTLYFAEGVAPAVKSGQHVNAGDTIATPARSPYGNAYGTTADGSGQIEWGVASDGASGSPTNPYADALGGGKCPAATPQSRSMVLNFATWAEQSFNLGKPTTTSDAGCG